MRLEFDAYKHVYTLDGVRLPSVTQIIYGVLPLPMVDEWHLRRGTATHLACELFDLGRLDWESVDPVILPRVQAWKAFRRDYGGVIVENEFRLADQRYQFAGTIDRVIQRGNELVVVDLKNSVSPQVELQLGGYSVLWKSQQGKPFTGAAAIELCEDGKFKSHWMTKHELRRAEQQFLACLSVYSFAQEHNLLKTTATRTMTTITRWD